MQFETRECSRRERTDGQLLAAFANVLKCNSIKDGAIFVRTQIPLNKRKMFFDVALGDPALRGRAGQVMAKVQVLEAHNAPKKVLKKQEGETS